MQQREDRVAKGMVGSLVESVRDKMGGFSFRMNKVANEDNSSKDKDHSSKDKETDVNSSQVDEDQSS